MIPDLCNIVGMGVVSIIRQRKCYYIELAIGKYVGTYSVQAAKIRVECITLSCTLELSHALDDLFSSL